MLPSFEEFHKEYIKSDELVYEYFTNVVALDETGETIQCSMEREANDVIIVENKEIENVAFRIPSSKKTVAIEAYNPNGKIKTATMNNLTGEIITTSETTVANVLSESDETNKKVDDFMSKLIKIYADTFIAIQKDTDIQETNNVEEVTKEPDTSKASDGTEVEVVS